MWKAERLPYIPPFVARSQIARNFGSARSLAVKVIGNYQYMDYNLHGSSARYITSGMPGAEFNGWGEPLNLFGHKDKKWGEIDYRRCFNGGHNQINYGVGSVYLGYKYKNYGQILKLLLLMVYNGSNGVSGK